MKQKDILIILILLFTSVLAWIGSSIYHGVVSSTISDTIKQDISPIKPTFDVKTINKIKERRAINPSFELGNITPTPTPLPIEILFPKNASEGGKLPL